MLSFLNSPGGGIVIGMVAKLISIWQNNNAKTQQLLVESMRHARTKGVKSETSFEFEEKISTIKFCGIPTPFKYRTITKTGVSEVSKNRFSPLQSFICISLIIAIFCIQPLMTLLGESISYPVTEKTGGILSFLWNKTKVVYQTIDGYVVLQETLSWCRMMLEVFTGCMVMNSR